MLDAVIPDVLWRPEPDHRGPLARFTDWVRENKGVVADDYAALHEWSVTDLEGFWSAVISTSMSGSTHRQPPCSARATCPGRSGFPAPR